MKIQHCPTCGARMTFIRSQETGYSEDAALVVSAHYECPVCGFAQPHYDDENMKKLIDASDEVMGEDEQ